MPKQKHKTVIISDTHLGKPNAQTEALLEFLKNNETETLIVNGDFIDFRQLNFFGKRTEKETQVMNHIIERTNQWMKLVYIKGNHDSFIKKLNHIQLLNINIVNDFIYTSEKGKKYYLCHGERFDFINHHMVRFWKISNIFYSIIYLIEKAVNKNMRKKWYIPYSEKLKLRLKEKFFPKNILYRKATELAKEKKCDGIIIGHYHMPEFITKNGMEYFNTWDRVTKCTAIIENKRGELKLTKKA